jgi:hypothetical protein
MYTIIFNSSSGQHNFTVNSLHILVLNMNTSIKISQTGENRYSVRWLELHTVSNSVRQLSKQFKDISAVQHFAHQLPQSFEWCVSVTQFLSAQASVQQAAKMFKPDRINFPTPRKSLTKVIKSVCSDNITKKSIESIAWQIGFYLTTNTVPTLEPVCNISQFHQIIQAYGLIASSDIPIELIIQSAEIRELLLAGIVDACAAFNVIDNSFQITLPARSSSNFAEQIIFLAKSLGYSIVPTANPLNFAVTGPIHTLPTKFHSSLSKSCIESSKSNHFSFELLCLGRGEYFGFTVSGPNGRLLLWDFTVTHNTISCLALILAYQYAHNDPAVNQGNLVGKLIYCTRTVQEMDKVVEELKKLIKYREQYYRAQHETQLKALAAENPSVGSAYFTIIAPEPKVAHKANKIFSCAVNY